MMGIDITSWIEVEWDELRKYQKLLLESATLNKIKIRILRVHILYVTDLEGSCWTRKEIFTYFLHFSRKYMYVRKFDT